MLFPIEVKDLIIAAVRRLNYRTTRRRLEARLHFPQLKEKHEYGRASNHHTHLDERLIDYIYSLPHLTLIYTPRSMFLKSYRMPIRYYSAIEIIARSGQKLATHVWELYSADGMNAEYVLRNKCQRCAGRPYHYISEHGSGSFEPLDHICTPRADAPQ